MNYRHAFHAGNFGDCVKHALLLALLRALLKKPAPLFVLDTHAGAGHYDLDGEPARRSNEAVGGILRLLDGVPPGTHDASIRHGLARPGHLTQNRAAKGGPDEPCHDGEEVAPRVNAKARRY